MKHHYKTLNKTKRDNFFEKINKDIDDGKMLNWNQFKKLKNYKSKNTVFDAADMDNFEKFFTKLYANEHQNISTERKATLLEESVDIPERTDQYQSNNDHIVELNIQFTCKEITDTITELKNGKKLFRRPYLQRFIEIPEKWPKRY